MENQIEIIRRGHPVGGRAIAGTPRRRAIQLYSTRPGSARRGTADLLRAVAILRNQWRVALLFAVAVLGVVTTATMLMRPIYEPEGRLQIDPPGAEVFSLQSNSGAITDSEYITTEAEKLQTADLALATIRTLSLDQNPELAGGSAGDRTVAAPSGYTRAERAALRSFRSHLSVRRDPGSRLVAVHFASHDPQLSAIVVNTLMKLFVDHDFEARHEAIMHSSTWLARQLDDIRDKVKSSSRQLAQYQQQHGIADVDNNSNTLGVQVGDLNKQLAEAQAQRIQLQAYLNRIKEGDSLPQISANPVVQALTQKQADIQVDLAQARVIYGATHPTVRKLENQRDQVGRELGKQRSAMVAELQTSYSAAQSRERLLEGKVRNAAEQLSRLEQYTNLKKEAEADRQLYNTLYMKVKEAGIAAASKSSNIRVVDEAAVLDHPTRPHRLFNIVVALMLGVIGGITTAFVKEGIQDRIHTAEDVRNWSGLSSVAVIPEVPSYSVPKRPFSGGGSLFGDEGSSRCMLLAAPNSPQSEAINTLRTFVLLSQAEAPPRVVLVTSPLPGEGKTTVATNLAAALAKHKKTCLIDADLRRPQAAATFGVPHGKGLVDLLKGLASLEEVAYSPGVEHLSIIGSSNSSDDPGELMTIHGMETVIARLREMVDFIVIDTPPILPYADGRMLSTLADGVIVVSRAATTPGTALTRTMELLAEVHSAPIITVVLNAADFRCADYRYYYAGYR